MPDAADGVPSHPSGSSPASSGKSALRGALLQELHDIEPLENQWDDLAVATKNPYCSPVWMLSWWRHCAPPGALLRVVVVLHGERLIGVAPFFAHRGSFGIVTYRLLASGNSFGLQPLALAGNELGVASLVADVLASSDPTPDILAFEGLPAGSGWPQLLRDTWPGASQPRLNRGLSLQAPALDMGRGTYDQWLMSKSSHFRKHMKQARRRLGARGGVFTLARTPEEVEHALTSFARLHYARWDPKGGSNALTPSVEAMLRDAAQKLTEDRFRLWSIEVDDHIISTQVFLAAGGEVAYWNGGFDEGSAADRPGIVSLLAAIEHAWEVGDLRFDFGAGPQDYKYRFANDGETLEWLTLVPMGPRYLLARLALIPSRLRLEVSRRLSQTAKRRLKQLSRWRR